MKLIRVLAFTLALLVFTAGCANRNNKNDTSNGMLGDVGSGVEEGVNDMTSAAKNGVDDLASGLEDGMSRLDEGMDDASHTDIDENIRDLNSSHMSADSAAAMSADFSEIGTLDATLENGFPGGSPDEKNRPSGPLTYQEKYGKYDACFLVPDSEEVFLTFDEGYENGYTARILDTLKQKDVKAVFFVTYPYVQAHPDLVQRMIDEGHTLGNHSTAHKVFPTLSLQDAYTDLRTLHDYVRDTFHYEMTLFRPPEGAFSEQTLALAQAMGYHTVLWSFAYKDWDVENQPLASDAIQTIENGAHPGEILLLHAVSQTNAEILGDVIDQTRAKGLSFSSDFSFSSAD